MKNKRNVVFSTDPDWKEDRDTGAAPAPKTQGTLYVLRDRKGRGGKTVTVVEGYNNEAKAMLKRLQKLCGSGGSVKGGNLEIQGDHRDKIGEFLKNEGFRVKFKGG